MPTEPRPAELTDEPLVVALPVQWGDQDAFGHVNNTVYFRWMESARIEYFGAAGLHELMTSQGVGPILASIKCDYRRQLKYPDSLLVSARVTGIGRTSIRMSHKLYSNSQKAVAAEGESVIVVFDYEQQRPTPVSDQVRAKIDAFQAQSPS
jgi:acyl-CoA thioester hydrolase